MPARLDSFIVIVSRIGRCVGPILLLFSSLQAANSKHGHHRLSKTLTNFSNFSIIQPQTHIDDGNIEPISKGQNTIKTQLEDRNKEINKLNIILESINNEKESLETELGNIRAERDKLKQELLSANQGNQILKEECATLNNKLRSTETDLQESKNNMQLLQLKSSQCADNANEYDNLYNQNIQLTTNFTQLHNKHKELFNKHEKLEKEYKENMNTYQKKLEQQKQLTQQKEETINVLSSLLNSGNTYRENSVTNSNTNQSTYTDKNEDLDIIVPPLKTNKTLKFLENTYSINSDDISDHEDSSEGIDTEKNSLSDDISNCSDFLDIAQFYGNNSDDDNYADDDNELKETKRALNCITEKYNDLQMEYTKLEKCKSLPSPKVPDPLPILPEKPSKNILEKKKKRIPYMTIYILSGVGIGSLLVEFVVLPTAKYLIRRQKSLSYSQKPQTLPKELKLKEKKLNKRSQ